MLFRSTSLNLEVILRKALERLDEMHGKEPSRDRVNDRVERLIQYAVMDREQKDAFLLFARIRNEFVHNLEVCTMRRALVNVGIKPETFLLKYPPNLKKTEEEGLVNAFIYLTAALRDSLVSLVARTKEKIEEFNRAQG